MGAIAVGKKESTAETDLAPGQHQLSGQEWSDVARTMKLSIREQQVCRLLFDGLTRQVIAEQLNISNRTVRHHMERIHQKLKVGNRVGVVLKIVHVRDHLKKVPTSELTRDASRHGEFPAEVRIAASPDIQ